ncbi:MULTISPECIES: DUF5312 family protein [unclassified Oceanispirochaeta]|uniref:DUF5312 family protein n=1 Tax=unclassified Oceanispirochaeta TaxID=2635722 RepID=UPI000E097306|nr:MULTISPECIES: DUF5312 family protein [unclassified Oceanispirochaeta]MBF9015449.1 hypothetical protein [Oceanispirochaeta sp. M2]NPD71908.1 hypothetical protein [Oceanispirochaeta sp. M1]RDG32716.1 hypothetical protein DV872_07335 [Oceanispirochaeta sp. M1]
MSFIEKIMGVFANLGDADRDKKRFLKEIGKDLKKRGKYFRVKGNTAQPALAKLFFDIYKEVGPAQVLLESLQGSDAIKSIIIEKFLSEDQVKLLDNLSEDNIRARCKSQKNLKVVKESIKQELIDIYSFFDLPLARKINDLYSALMILQEFIRFDYYFFLKKFDSMLPERDFSYNTRFDSINGEYIVDDLKDFDIILPTIDVDADWESLLDILAMYRDMEVISRDGWKKVLNAVKEFRKTEILKLMIIHLDEDVAYKVVPEHNSYEIVEDFLSSVKKTAENTLMSIVGERKKSQQDSLLMAIFGTTSVVRLKYYTERSNMAFSKKINVGYQYVEPMNYLKAFYLDYYKGPIRRVVDKLLITGQWTTSLASQQFSESYHQLMTLSDDLLKFDNNLADETEMGGKLKRLAKAADRDRSALDAMRNVLNNVNSEGLTIINESVQNLFAIGKNLKRCIDDYKAPKHELVVNWKEIEMMSELPIIEEMSEIYKKIYYFLQLMQYYLKEES